MSISPKSKKIIFFSTIIFDSLLKLLLFLSFFSNNPFFIFLSLLFLILATVLIWGLLKNYRWGYELLIGYGVLTLVLCVLVSIPSFFLSFIQPFGSSKFLPVVFLTGLAFLLACIPTVIMIILAREYKAQANN